MFHDTSFIEPSLNHALQPTRPVKRTIFKAVLSSAALLSLAILAGCVAMAPTGRITREDISYAIQNKSAVVEAEVAAGKPNAVGTRSEGYVYSIRVVSLLHAGEPPILPSFTYDYSKTPVLRPGRYILILQGGLYYRAERLSTGSARLTEIRQWTQHP